MDIKKIEFIPMNNVKNIGFMKELYLMFRINAIEIKNSKK